MNQIPRWATHLMPHIQLTDSQLARLESIRIEAGVDDASMKGTFRRILSARKCCNEICSLK